MSRKNLKMRPFQSLLRISSTDKNDDNVLSKTDDNTKPPDDYNGSDTKSNLKETEVKTKTPAPVGEKGAEVNGSDPEGKEPKILHTAATFPFEP